MSIKHIIPPQVTAEERRQQLYRCTGMLFLIQLRKVAYQAAGDVIMFVIYSHMEATMIARISAWRQVQL